MSEGNLAAPNPPALGPRRGSWRPRSIRAKATISLVMDSRDAHEGCSAFLEKRKARFEGA